MVLFIIVCLLIMFALSSGLIEQEWLIDFWRTIEYMFFRVKKFLNIKLIYNKERDDKPLSVRCLAAYYEVNPDTMENWITYFSKAYLVFAYKCSQKKMNETFEQKIKNLFGKPSKKDEIVSKAKLVDKLREGNNKSIKTCYRNLKEIILRKFPELKDCYSKIDYFPPLIGNKILAAI